MAETTRTKSNVHFVLFARGAAGLVDGIAALSGAGRRKSTIKPLGKTVSDVLDSAGKILQKEVAKIEYLEEKDVQFHTVTADEARSNA